MATIMHAQLSQLILIKRDKNCREKYTVGNLTRLLIFIYRQYPSIYLCNFRGKAFPSQNDTPFFIPDVFIPFYMKPLPFKIRSWYRLIRMQNLIV